MSKVWSIVSSKLIVALHPPPHPRAPRLLVGWVPGAPNRVRLSQAHALVLAEMASGRRHWTPEAWAAARDEAAWNEAAASLLRAGLCVEGGAEQGRYPPFDSAIERHIGNAASIPETLPNRLQLPWNFAMRPGPEGFMAFSVRSRKYLLLPPEAVSVLLAFINPAAADSVTLDDAARSRSWVEWFFAHGLLAPEPSLSGKRVVSTHLADMRAACVQEQTQLSEELEQLAAVFESSPSRPGARTPVYFISATTDPEVRSQLPLGIGMILAHARAYENGALLDSYDFVPELLLSPAAVRRAVQRHGPGIVLFSDYLWTREVNLGISRALKKASREFVTIHGGPSVPAHEEESTRFFAQNEHVDVAVRGEGELTAAEILKALTPFSGRPIAGLPTLREVAGLTFRDPSTSARLVRTVDRPRIPDVNVLPSAYLSGAFDSCQHEQVIAAILETNRGCPYGCTFCDWGAATLQKIRTFSLQRVQAEIEWIAAHHIPIVWCSDANFGILERDVEIARMVRDARQRHGFPRQFLVSYAKNATARLAEIIRIFRDADVAAEGIISLQTADEQTLGIIRRSNIKPKKYDELIRVFRDLKLPVSTDLMIGLPGATVESFASDLQYCIDRGVPARAFPTRLLVNSPMADPAYQAKYGIEVDEQDYVVSTFSFTRDDLRSMNRLYEAYRLYETCGVLFYVLRYLQWEHGIQAADFLRRLVEVLGSDPTDYPSLAWVDRYSPWNLNPGGFRPFYEELARYLGEQYGLAGSSALETVLRVQEAVMREPGRALPETVSLVHDFVAWWRAHGTAAPPAPGQTRLQDYPPAEFTVSDPDDLCGLDLTRQRQYDYHYIRWELQSSLRAADSVAMFLGTG